MIPFVGVAATIAQGMSAYRDVFCREAGFGHVSRYVNGVLLSENKTLQGIAAQQVYPEGQGVSRRAIHAAVFEAGWKSEQLMQRHREVVGKRHQGRGREVISLDWILSHHEDGFEIYGVKRSYDYVNHCMSRFQTVVTAVVANPQAIDGLAVEVQLPNSSIHSMHSLVLPLFRELSVVEPTSLRLYFWRFLYFITSFLRFAIHITLPKSLPNYGTGRSCLFRVMRSD